MGAYTIIIDGIPIKFPYENPYDIQIDYMKKVLQSLEQGRHAILESPTGTGKTLSLLCTTLGWLSKQKEIKRAWTSQLLDDSDHDDDNVEKKGEEGVGADKENAIQNNKNGAHFDLSGLEAEMADDTIPMEKIPKVIYASRTHSQLTQVMGELKNSPYKDIKAGVFGSRTHLCINPNVMKKPNAMYKCRRLTKNNGCAFKNNLHAKMNEPAFKRPILDIEDLGKLGDEFNCCPYYASKELSRDAEIVFLPYNYLLDPKIRDFCAIDLKNAIVILDEAHNVEKACEQSSCASITTMDLTDAKQELNRVLRALNLIELNEENDENLGFKREHVADLQLRLHALEGLISQNDILSNNKMENGGHLFELFQLAQITNENYKGYDKLMNNLIQFLHNEDCDGKGLKNTSEFLRIAFSSSATELKNKVNQCCMVQIENSTTLNFWCLSPALGMKPLFEKGIRCLIMTSGTLEPVKELEREMEIPNPITLINKHIIKPSQVFVNIVSKGKDGAAFCATSKKRKKLEYLTSLGESIVDLCDSIPGGLLIFFASYGFMSDSQNFWKGPSGIWEKMIVKRDIYCETKGESSDKLEETKKKYYESIDTKGGAIFMAVLRGKVSEGVDFIDVYGRAVVIVGIPLAVFNETNIESKRKYMDGRHSADSSVLSGRDWYHLDAIKAVNQAIGRVIRHKDDYGAILLCDERYNDADKRKHLSTWVRENTSSKKFTSFPAMITHLKEFFANCERTLPKPKSKHQPVSVTFDSSDVDDDSVYTVNANANRQSSHNHTNGVSGQPFAVHLEEENSNDRNFLDDESLSDQYSDSSYSGRNHKNSKKRQRRSTKKHAANGRTQPYTSPKNKLKKEASTSAMESSYHQNTDDERFIDDGNSTNDSDFMNDESMNDQYSTSTPFKAMRATTVGNRKDTPVKRPSRNSPQPSTSFDRADSAEEENGNDNDSDEAAIETKRARNGMSFNRIICVSDSESDSSMASATENPILDRFKRSLNTNQYKKLVEAFHEYNKNNGSYESYRDALFELFSGANEASNLIGMMLLLKFEHQSQFDEDIQRKFAE